ncbi:MAG TPA: cell division ATP-binding protein FtsE [Alphaproteobacteria bacterium]|jgi:cell division transport system ATP-binding protein|nr:cell division ATP-binding protein FtsE [Alphaproteobacteria bacterium]
MISFDNVGFRYGVGPEILHDISVSIEPGSFHFLTGASGAGKTTLLNMMHLSLRPTRGFLSVFGQDVGALKRRRMPALRRQIGMVFQDFRLLDHMSVFDNVALPLRLAGEKERDIRRDVTSILEWVGLGDTLQATPRALSGGEQQRVAIARAVVARPGILLADEPTGSVDEAIGQRILRLFEELNRLGTAIVIATHNRSLIERFPHARLDLDDGNLVRLPGGGGQS